MKIRSRLSEHCTAAVPFNSFKNLQIMMKTIVLNVDGMMSVCDGLGDMHSHRGFSVWIIK
jgi:hypothetical protein